MIKVYYWLELSQASPLHLSNGNSFDTDSDLMKDSRGLPFIPGSGLAGALRDMLSPEQGTALFGWVDGNDQKASEVIVPDAVLPSDTPADAVHLTQRDGVGIDQFRGTARKTAKYDFEAVETAIAYQTCLEWTGEPEDTKLAILDTLIRQTLSGGLHLGGKTSRGYGQMRVNAWKKVFCFPKDLSTWLDFSAMTKDTGWEKMDGLASTTDIVDLRIKFDVAGALSVRVYSTAVSQPDSTPMKNSAGKVIIPGTSWAGAFRHRMHKIGEELNMSDSDLADIDTLFGVCGSEIKKSQISFSESIIEGGKQYDLTRNALDRFTAGPANTSLYTTGYWQGGSGTLTIQIKRDSLSSLMRELLLAAVRDLHFGLMTIGGNAAAGMGCLRITRLVMDGEDLTATLEE